MLIFHSSRANLACLVNCLFVWAFIDNFCVTTINFLYVFFQAMLKLARMYLTVDDLDACQQQCVQLLKMDAENDDATVVSASRFLQLTSFVCYVLHVECSRNCLKATLKYLGFCFCFCNKSYFVFQMMADLMFRKNEYDSATFHFQQLLERKPGEHLLMFYILCSNCCSTIF